MTVQDHAFDLGCRWGFTIAEIYGDGPDGDSRRMVLLSAVVDYINTHDDTLPLVQAIVDANSGYECHGFTLSGSYCPKCGTTTGDPDEARDG